MTAPDRNIAFIAHMTRPEFDRMLEAILALQVPYEVTTWGQRVRFLADAEYAMRKQGYQIQRITLTADQIMQFAQLTEGDFSDPDYQPGAQLAMLIGYNRLARGTYD